MAKIIGIKEDVLEIVDGETLHILDINLANFNPNVGDDVVILKDLNNKASRIILSNKDIANNQLNENKTSTSLVLGIVGIVLSAINFIGIPFVHLVGIALGIIGLSVYKKENQINNTAKYLNILAIAIGALAALIGFIIGLMGAL